MTTKQKSFWSAPNSTVHLLHSTVSTLVLLPSYPFHLLAISAWSLTTITCSVSTLHTLANQSTATSAGLDPYDATSLMKHAKHYATLTAKLDNCNSLLYGLPDNTIGLLQRAQNTAARIITRTRKFAPITPVLTHLHWLPVRLRIDYKILLLTFKAIHNQTPAYISDLLQPYIPTRTLRSSTKKLLTSTTYKTITYGGRAFSYAAPKLWNVLPLDIRESPNLETFKRKLKTHLFSKAYSVV